MAKVTEGIHGVVVVLDGLFFAPLPGFFIPEVGVDLPEEAGARLPADPDPAAPDEHRCGGDALPDFVFCVPDAEPPAAELRLMSPS